MPEDSAADPFDITPGARRLAIDLVIRGLVDAVSTLDPGLRDRISAEAEAYFGSLNTESEVESAFHRHASETINGLIRPLKS